MKEKDYSHIHVRKLPIVTIVCILEKLLLESFDSFYNCFVSFIRINDIAYAVAILREIKTPLFFSIRFYDLTTKGDRLSHVMNFADNYDLPDAVFYVSFRALVLSDINKNIHYERLEDMAVRHNHYLSKLAVNILKFFFETDTRTSTMQVLLHMLRDDYICMITNLRLLSTLQFSVHPRQSRLRRLTFPELCPEHEESRNMMRYVYGVQTMNISNPECDTCHMECIARIITHNFY